MHGKLARKWRPSLALVLTCTLGAVLCLPLIGIVAVRYLWPVLGYREAVIVVGCGVVLVTGYVGWVLWRILLRPITALAEQADSVRHGSDTPKLPAHYGTAEMFALGHAMIEMGIVLKGREAVVRSYADHATHELRSPLTVVRGAAELLADPELPQNERARLLANVQVATNRMDDLLEAQRRLARAQEPLSSGLCRLSDACPEIAGLNIEVAPDGDVPLSRDVLRMVLSHLAGNAAAHGAQNLTLRMQDDMLNVVDDGPGISAGNRERVFDPFFTTRRATGGTGMGLSIVRRLLEAQDAQISLGRDGPGATFVISFR